MPGYDGGHLVPQLPFNSLGGGIDLGSAVVLPPGGNVIYLRSTAPDDFDPPGLNNRYATTLLEAAKYCRANRGDTIMALPGHSENHADALQLANLVAGTRIIGLGWGGQMPTFRFTATGSQWPISVANVHIQGLRLRLEGANGVVKAIVITGADCTVSACDIEVASGTTAKSTIAVEVGTGAHRCLIVGNKFRGTATHNVTDGVKVAGAVDQIEIRSNRMQFSATAANGLVHVTAAATALLVAGNYMYNTHTASTACIKIDDVASDGMIADNHVANVNDGTAAAQGVVFAGTTNTTVKCTQNFSVDEKGKSGVLAPAAVST